MSDEQEYVIVFGADGDPALVEKERDWVQVDDLHGNEENWVEDIESDTDTNEKTNGTKNVTQLINDLEDYQETLEAMDPITQIYQKIINGINQMRLYNQSIHDAIVLATDQVQDKRIDWLEEGPEVTTTDILLEFALVFFLDSGLATLLLKTCIKKTFKFAADEKRIRAIRRLGKFQSKTDAELLKGTKKLYRMDEEYKSVQKQINKSNNKVLAQRIELDKFYDKKGSAIWNPNKKANDMALARAEAKLKKYTDETKGWLDQKAKLNKEIEEFVGALKTNQREIEKKQLLKWFLSGKEKSSKSPKRIAEMDRGAAKAIYTTSADEKEISLQVSNDLNSLGVQIKNNAQNFLRKQELFLNNLYRIADNFYIRGLMDPQIKSVIHLNEIYQMIPQEDNRPEEEKHKELLDLKQDIMLFFEKLIWSLFLPLEQFGEGLYDDNVLDRFAIYYIKRFGLDDTIYAKTHGENLNFVDVNDVIRDLKSVRSDFEKLLRENKEPTPLQMVGEKLKFKR